VLSCARARISDPHHICDLLLIDRRLIEVIQDSLRDQRALASDFSLTADGLAALESGVIDSAEVKTVYSFTCAVSGAILPRFSEQLFFADTKIRDRKVQIAHQDEGDDRFYPCFRVLPSDDSEPPSPLADDILRAALRHARDRRGATSAVHQRGVDEALPFAPQLNRVHVVDRHAQPLYVATIAYLDPSPLAEPGSIVVADPFGLGISRVLRDELLRIQSRDRNTQEWIAKIVRPASGATELIEDRRQDWELCASEARSRLCFRGSHHPVLDQLTAVELALLGANVVDIAPQQRQRLLKDAGHAGRDALEAGFMALADFYPFAAISEVVGRLKFHDEDLIQQQLKGACRALGFDGQIPQRFSRIRVGDLQSVVLYRRFSKLASVVAASLIIARRHSSHPFRTIARTWPEFLSDTADALAVAGEAAHHQAEGAPDPAKIDKFREYLYKCLRFLLSSDADHREPI
jgi:hypothetical protein